VVLINDFTWPQIIPGRIELAYYDLGGEGVALNKTRKNFQISKIRKFYSKN
jgi:hypothetical protein